MYWDEPVANMKKHELTRSNSFEFDTFSSEWGEQFWAFWYKTIVLYPPIRLVFLQHIFSIFFPCFSMCLDRTQNISPPMYATGGPICFRGGLMAYFSSWTEGKEHCS